LNPEIPHDVLSSLEYWDVKITPIFLPIKESAK